MMMKSAFLSLLLPLLLLTGAVQAQRKSTSTTPADLSTSSRRLLPRFGGATAAEAEQLLGSVFLADVSRSFSSRTEASEFFANKGYDYLSENQPDTAMYRFNLAWALDPHNAEAYRGMAIVLSKRNPADTAIPELVQAGLAQNPNHSLLLADLGNTLLARYATKPKSKDLTAAIGALERATSLLPSNTLALRQLAQAYFYQESYLKSWETLHKVRAQNLGAVDFGLVEQLLAKLPDPQGTFK